MRSNNKDIKFWEIQKKKTIGNLCGWVFTVFSLVSNLLILTLTTDISRFESTKQSFSECGESSSAIIKNLLNFNSREF